MIRHECVTEDLLTFLDVHVYRMRSQGKASLMCAIPDLMNEFPELTKREAIDTLVYWMETYGDNIR